MSVNVMGVVCALVIIICMISGFRKGFIRKLNKILSIVLSALLVNALLPYVTQAIRNNTPLYSLIYEQCDKVISTTALQDAMASIAGTSTDTSGNSGSIYDREAVRSLLDEYGLDSSQVDYLSDNELTQLLQQYVPDYASRLGSGVTAALSSLTKIEQTRLIQNLPIPDFMQNLMISYNNSEGYSRLNVTDFGGYIIGFIANLILNVLAFIVTLLVVWLIVRLILGALNIAARLPLIGAADRAAGLLLGAFQGVIIVWMIDLVITLFSGTEIGLNLLTMIRQSALAYPLYQSDVFLRIVTNSIENIL